MSQPQQPFPQQAQQWIDDNGAPTQVFRFYMTMLDRFVRALGIGVGNQLLGDGKGVTLTAVAAPGNANAAVAGVPLGGLYCGTADPAIVYIRTV